MLSILLLTFRFFNKPLSFILCDDPFKSTVQFPAVFYFDFFLYQGETHLVLLNGLAKKCTTLPDSSLQYLPTNIRDKPIVCYDPLC